jgi:nitroreductase
MIKEIKLRSSIRKYIDKPVDDEKILRLLESARLAPSGSNTQPWHFIIIRDEEIKQRIAKVSHNQEWMLSAPVFIVCVADIRSRIESDIEIILDEESPQNDLKKIIRDTAIAVEHIVLEAINEGLGTCWVAWFTQNEIRPILGLPNDKYVVSIITIGFPDEEPKPRNRKELKEIIHYDKW